MHQHVITFNDFQLYYLYFPKTMNDSKDNTRKSIHQKFEANDKLSK